MNTVLMKLTSAIVVGGEVVKPPAIVEVSNAEAADLARRGKAVAATEDDVPTAVTPSAENAKGEGEGTNPPAGASEQTTADATVDVGGQDAGGTTVVTDTSAEAAALREQANAAAEAARAAEAVAAHTTGKNAAQKKADRKAADDAAAAAAVAEEAAKAAEAKLIPAT